MIITFKQPSNVFGFIFGRDTNNKVVSAFYANQEVINLSNVGKYALSSDRLTLSCTITQYTFGFILCENNSITNITYE